MSDAEGLMWRLEKDPHLSSTFATVTLLDQTVDIERLRRRMAYVVALVPRLRQRVQPSPVSLTPPSWVDDPGFDLAYHVRHIGLPAPGTERQLWDLATLIASDALDRTRPLWEYTLVDGIEGGKAALIQKMHHTITDGEGGVKLSLLFLDAERDAPDLELPPAAEPSESPPDPRATAGPFDGIRDILAGSMRMPLGMARQMRELMANPAGIPAAGQATLSGIKGVATQLGDTERAHSTLWTERSLRRHLEVLDAPFADTKRAAKNLGGTLNTAFVTAAAQAAGDYHRRLGQPVETLRTSMAISTRDASSGSNAFSLAKLDVPAGEMPIADRFRAIHEASQSARSSGRGSMATLAAVATTLPTSLITRLARSQAQTVDFATSNVRAAPYPFYLCGGKILHNYPIGPLAGVAFNLTLVSYAGSLDMGLHVDAAAVAEPQLLRELMEEAFAALIATA
jgi:diacylglycerol O-acyltransferase / wax synthase